jgi:hypothetical protein
MKIASMFQKEINRNINGVIKVAQDDEVNLRQELEEYIITKELKKHFEMFFNNYSSAIDTPTDKMGVWISGFFGSGKSHFLKILSYLLSNKKVDGKKAVSFFEDKINDPLLYATVVRCTNIPTESILFNIDIQAPTTKDKTVILRIFAKVFYKHLGYYGDDLKVAKFEQYIDSQGKTEEFRKVFKEINGSSWIESRETFAFIEDDIVSVMQSVFGMSETAARNWFNGEENGEMSIDKLSAEIEVYVNSKGENFRLLFCIDEVGQYIGDDRDLMLNLQSVVEALGTKCREKVWVMVTSQEAIDEVINVTGDDFSKIQGRFTTRLSLSSASVDEVIKKRILEKNEDADRLLCLEYERERSVLKNLFTFSESVSDLKGYSSADEFSSTFPFVPYQFIIIQKVLAEIRKHGNSGKHLSGGERSMLSGFQEAAQKVQEKDENTLVPFSNFYDTVHTFLESPIRRVIDRCQNAADRQDGIEQQDVPVLKLLYLIRYITDIKANIDNIAVLLIEDIRVDKIELRKQILESLVRLERQNYISRNGDTYAFLTDEEQDIALDIRNTVIDTATIIREIGETIFSEIYPSKKFKYDKYDFSFDQYVDGTRIGSASGGVRLRFVTETNDYYNTSKEKLGIDSHTNQEAIILLASGTQYFEELELAAKIDKYVKQKNVSQLPERVQDIIRGRQAQRRKLIENAKIKIAKAIVDGTFYIYGEQTEIKHGDTKAKIDEILKQLVISVYNKLHYVNFFSESDSDILLALNSKFEEIQEKGTGGNNEYALNEISQWLELQANNHLPVSVGDVQRRFQAIPFGWREIDIAVMIARLIVSQKIEIRYGGAVVGKDDKNFARYLRVKTEIDKVSVQRRIAPSEELMRKTVKFLREWLGQMSIPEDEDGLVAFIINIVTSKKEAYNRLTDEYSRESYPQKEVVISARNLMSDILAQKSDNVALLKYLVGKQDDLINVTEDIGEIEAFFKSQRDIFDSARKLYNKLVTERDYFAADTDTKAKIADISAILNLPKPYNKIKDLPGLMQDIKAAYGVLLEQKKDEVNGIITQCMGDVHTLAGIKAREEVEKADERFTEYRESTSAADSLTRLDAMIQQILNFKDGICKRIEALLDDSSDGKKAIQLRRYDVFPVKRLTSKDDVDSYLENIREKLYKTLESGDSIQIN